MSSVKEFMSAGEIKKFSCGTGFGFLDRLFKRVSDADKAERVERIKEMISDTAIGRETLDFLAENGTSVAFEKMKAYGFYAPEKNVVALNWKASDCDLAMTLIHETRHARQDKTMARKKSMINVSLDMTPETLLKNGLMVEADACAAECVFAHEKAEKGDDRFFAAQKKSPYAKIGEEFERKFAETGDMNKARETAMLKWYDLPVRDLYADDYVRYMELAEKRPDELTFKVSVPVKDMAEMLCADGRGKCYLSDPSVLNDPDKACLDPVQSKDMQRSIFAFCRAKQRGLEGLGLDRLFTRYQNDGYTRVLSDMNFESTAPVKAAFLQNARGR